MTEKDAKVTMLHKHLLVKNQIQLEFNLLRKFVSYIFCFKKE